MNENEVIIVDQISERDYDSLIMDCVKYSIISLPFTVDRMGLNDEKKRALNIAKGKIAESLFRFFCDANGIHPDFDSCATPFWTVDNRDFILDGNEWDIKNNFYYSDKDVYSGNYTFLPALVPNRFDGDQWSKRNDNINIGTNGVEFLFTFLRGAPLINGQRGQDFLDINLTPEQLQFLIRLYRRYQGQPQTKQPFSDEDFWRAFERCGGMNLFTLYSRPHLIITAYANSSHWTMFTDTGKSDRTNALMTAIRPAWYSKTARGSLNFLNGTLWTTITNKTCPIFRLPSFLSKYPHLQNGIKLGRLKQSIWE